VRVKRVEARGHEDRPGVPEEPVAADWALPAPVDVGQHVCAALDQVVHAALALVLLGARPHHAQQPRLLPIDQTARALQRHEGRRLRVRGGQLDLQPGLHVPAGRLASCPRLQQAAHRTVVDPQLVLHEHGLHQLQLSRDDVVGRAGKSKREVSHGGRLEVGVSVDGL
jgi:hypothetical protein